MATTEDHCPSRAYFLNKRWPEGYSFGACKRCNRDSSRAEFIFPALTLLAADLKDSTVMSLARKTVVNADRRTQGLIEKMLIDARPSVDGTRLGQAEGLLAVPVPPLMKAAIGVVASKLGRALHYKHTGGLMSFDCPVRYLARTNASELTIDDFGRQMADLMGGVVPISRAKTDLSDQFDYAFGVSDDREFASFAVVFRSVLALFIITGLDEQWHRDTDAELAERLDGKLRSMSVAPEPGKWMSSVHLS